MFITRLLFVKMVVLVSTLNIQVKKRNLYSKSITHTFIIGVDGHTVLRYVSDIYTDTILRFARTINSQTKSIFHNYQQTTGNSNSATTHSSSNHLPFDHNPRKIEWHMTEEIELGIQFAETRLSDLILQNEVKVLEFDDYGKYFITDMKMSPDAFVQVN